MNDGVLRKWLKSRQTRGSEDPKERNSETKLLILRN